MGLAHWISLWLLQAAFADTVAVESEPRAGELDQVLLDGCNGALGAARCSAAGTAAGAAPTWLVRVRWAADGRRAQVEFRRGDGSAAPSETREVEFVPADSDAQRRRAVGLIIAAYVVEQAEARAKAAGTARPAPEPEAEPVAEPKPAPDPDADADSDSDSRSDTVIEIAPDLVPPPRPPEWAIDVALLAGPGFERGAPRLGLMLRGLVWPLSLPIAGTASVRGAQRFDEPSARWLSATLGVAWQLVPQLHTVGLELRAEAALQNVSVSAEAPAGTADGSESGDAWRGGAIAGADMWLQLGAGAALLAGFELALLRPSVRLDVGGAKAGLDPALTWAGTLGVRMAH